MFVNMFEYVVVCSVWLAACLSVSVYGGLECKCACVSGYGWTCTYKHTNTHTHAHMHRWLYPYLATLLAWAPLLFTESVFQINVGVAGLHLTYSISSITTKCVSSYHYICVLIPLCVQAYYLTYFHMDKNPRVVTLTAMWLLFCYMARTTKKRKQKCLVGVCLDSLQ